MSWTYEVSTRKFYHNGTFQFTGSYAGAPGYKNDPTQECVKDRGPLPRGSYQIGPPHTSHRTGKYSLSLTPSSSNNMCDRDAFKIHGDSSQHPGEASSGCIVTSLTERKRIWASGDRELTVK
ncbi:tlde1 domain-containing protein [Rahnella victoriana]|uniref:DUF2778 domain-containing protein n=1 Tax=Rahnella victoriana TaxID=1510570 RepID=A0ABS0DPZ0_9GAMM|nr:tlde1 domain-containing protein [Rahnella victoriana]MBF7955949.1 DUF2778 domain-containing protein [Rahnella victoriana]UHM90024.1 DUF2778 domain-containing protein [Rahnella victoriana]